MKYFTRAMSKISKLSIVIGIIFICANSKAQAKAPFSSDGPGTKINKKRYPAGLDLVSLDDYLDMDCIDFYNNKSNDEFIVFTRKRFNAISKNFCERENDSSIESEISQDMYDSNDEGTFSKLIESYYNEFKFEKQMSYFLDQKCEDLINPETNKEFAIFFKNYINQLNPRLCELIEADQTIGVSSIESQREGVGQGTFSKIVEQAFSEYSYLKE